ncbi:hypothetical protein PL11201_700090 [Planktothrix sp. PCC 11201]|nr:hypothetical protein PL11201_700090 [Planktothrix sp. PCC 11201]
MLHSPTEEGFQWSLLFVEVELMETPRAWTLEEGTTEVASIRRSGINGNDHHGGLSSLQWSSFGRFYS